MLGGRQCSAADEQASKSSPTRRSGLVVKSERKATREEYLSVVCRNKSIVVFYKREIKAISAGKRPCSVTDTTHFASNTFAVTLDIIVDTSINKMRK